MGEIMNAPSIVAKLVAKNEVIIVEALCCLSL